MDSNYKAGMNLNPFHRPTTSCKRPVATASNSHMGGLLMDFRVSSSVIDLSREIRVGTVDGEHRRVRAFQVLESKRHMA